MYFVVYRSFVFMVSCVGGWWWWIWLSLFYWKNQTYRFLDLLEAGECQPDQSIKGLKKKM